MMNYHSDARDTGCAIVKAFCVLFLCFLANSCASAIEDFQSGLLGRSQEDEKKARVAEVNASTQDTYSSALYVLQENGLPVERAEGSLLVTGWTSVNLDYLSDAEWKLTVTVSSRSSGSYLSIAGTVQYVNFVSGQRHVEAVGRTHPPLLNKIEEIKWAIKRRAERN